MYIYNISTLYLYCIYTLQIWHSERKEISNIEKELNLNINVKPQYYFSLKYLEKCLFFCSIFYNF